MSIYKIIGAVGLLSISIGVVTSKREIQDILYIIGGVCLEIYSIYLGDVIFIVLQVVFTLSAVYDLVKNKYLEQKV